MKFIIVALLASLAESLSCETSFNNRSRVRGISSALMEEKDIPKSFDWYVCKNCLSFKEPKEYIPANSGRITTLENALNKLREKIGYNDPDDRFPKLPGTSYYLKDTEFINDYVCCPDGKECTAKISWDGQKKFELDYSIYSPQNVNYNNDTSEWKYNLLDKDIRIYNIIPGGTRRKFLFAQFAVKVKGLGEIVHETFFKTYRESIYFDTDPIDAMTETIGNNGKVAHIATILSFVDF